MRTSNKEKLGKAHNVVGQWGFSDRNAIRAYPLPDETKGSSKRSPFARDRDRILYSKPLRRLAYKTQVYLTTNANIACDEHTRTRLTHTLEVAQIAKSIVSALGLNIELAESIAFGHDVGHAPFGHAGERQIDDFLNGLVPLPSETAQHLGKKDEYRKAFSEDLGRDFKHNYQSVRLLCMLERYSSAERNLGLNLTFQTLAGILNHTKTHGIRTKAAVRYPNATHIAFSDLLTKIEYQSVESKIVAIADEIAQVVHDLCDAIKTDVITVKELREGHAPTVPIIEKCFNFARASDKAVDFSSTGESAELVAQFCSIVVNYFVRKTTNAIRDSLETAGDYDINKLPEVLKNIGSTPYPIEDYDILRGFKDSLIVNNFNVNRMDNRGRYIIRQLIKSYLTDPRQLPDSVLLEFMKMKKSEMHPSSNIFLKKWFTTMAERFKIARLTTKQITDIGSLIESDGQGRGLRQAPHDLVTAFTPYLACDTDFLRAIADYIATMTDRFAEKESTALYE